MDVEEMRWQIMKVYPGTDWLADCAVFPPNKVAYLYTMYKQQNRIK